MKLERIQSTTPDKTNSSAKPGGIKNAVQVVTGDELSVNDKPEDRPKHQFQGSLYTKRRVLENKAEEKKQEEAPASSIIESKDVELDITV